VSLILQAELPALIWMATPVQHFPTAKGEYDPAELGKQCQPLKAWHEVRILPKPPNLREGISGSQRWFTHFVTARKAYTYLQLPGSRGCIGG